MSYTRRRERAYVFRSQIFCLAYVQLTLCLNLNIVNKSETMDSVDVELYLQDFIH
jgi:hypothetical protein